MELTAAKVMYKHTIPALFPLIAPSLTWKVKTTDKALYLTFDDGPHPVITPKVLNLLYQYEAKATFFCVGENVKKFPAVFADIVEGGHRVGNHTYNHLSGWKTSNEKYLKNVAQASAFIESGLFRPPYGQISPGQIASLKQQYSIIMWSILTRDYEHDLDAEKALKTMIACIKPGDIIVLHDSEKAEANMLYILKGLLEHFSKQQFLFRHL